MTKIKQNLLMNLAPAQGGAAADSFAEEIDEHGDDKDAPVVCTISAANTDCVRGVFTWKKRSGADDAKNNETGGNTAVSSRSSTTRSTPTRSAAPTSSTAS